MNDKVKLVLCVGGPFAGKIHPVNKRHTAFEVHEWQGEMYPGRSPMPNHFAPPVKTVEMVYLVHEIIGECCKWHIAIPSGKNYDEALQEILNSYAQGPVPAACKQLRGE